MKIDKTQASSLFSSKRKNKYMSHTFSQPTHPYNLNTLPKLLNLDKSNILFDEKYIARVIL